MTAINTSFSLNEPNYYHREYSNDAAQPENPSWTDQSTPEKAQRVLHVALPYITLYKPLSFPISIGMGAMRIVSNMSQFISCINEGQDAKTIAWHTLQTSIAVISLAGTLFAHPLGMLVTTAQDLAIDMARMAESIKKGDHRKALECGASILNNTLYLALFFHGGLELSIASLGMQILNGIYHSCEDLKKGNLLEAAGHIGMAMIRGNQMKNQMSMLSQKWKMDAMIEKLHANRKTAENNQETVKMTQTVPSEETTLIPLHNALTPQEQDSRDRITAQLKELGYDICQITKSGDTVIHRAVRKQDATAVLLALQYGFDPNRANQAGNTSLHLAAEKGNLEILQLLKNWGGNILLKNHLDQTPYHMALKNDHVSILPVFEQWGYEKKDPLHDYLTCQGLMPDKTDAAGNNYLHRIIASSNIPLMERVLREGGYQWELMGAYNNKGERPIHQAIKNKDEPMLQLILGKYAGRLVQYKDLQVATINGWSPGLNLLLPHFSKTNLLNQQDHLNRNLLHDAIYSGDLETVRLWLDYGLPVNKSNVARSTMKFIIDHRIGNHWQRVNLEPVMTPLSMALFFHPEKTQILTLLKTHGAIEGFTHAHDWSLPEKLFHGMPYFISNFSESIKNPYPDLETKILIDGIMNDVTYPDKVWVDKDGSLVGLFHKTGMPVLFQPDGRSHPYSTKNPAPMLNDYYYDMFQLSDFTIRK